VLSEEEVARRFRLLRSVGEECVTEADLTQLVSKKEHFRLYDGFEPSGRMHIAQVAPAPFSCDRPHTPMFAQGIFKAINVNKCTKAGGTFVFWVADWFALMNDKMGGDLDKIRDVGQVSPLCF
jgi:tyrosyl-tRNA synthetase